MALGAVLALAAAGGAAVAAEEPECLGPPGPSRLLVTIPNLGSSDGLIAATLYPDDSGRFLVHHGQLYVQHVKAEAPETRFCLWLPDEAGAYALVVYHDANGDHKFNRTKLGLPAEGYGLSNDPPTFLGLPTFSSVRFKTHAGDNPIQIRMHYPH
ncbi:MAG: DUF2141 domain-containing protein [Caulobacteraceae bacterium]